jgi:hypothetical protein
VSGARQRPTPPDIWSWLIGLDGLITTQRVQTATTPVTVLADIYTFK